MIAERRGSALPEDERSCHTYHNAPLPSLRQSNRATNASGTSHSARTASFAPTSLYFSPSALQSTAYHRGKTVACDDPRVDKRASRAPVHHHDPHGLPPDSTLRVIQAFYSERRNECQAYRYPCRTHSSPRSLA